MLLLWRGNTTYCMVLIQCVFMHLSIPVMRLFQVMTIFETCTQRNLVTVLISLLHEKLYYSKIILMKLDNNHSKLSATQWQSSLLTWHVHHIFPNRGIKMSK